MSVLLMFAMEMN